ncbi:MAG: hypothetical protein AAF730_18630 [Bacteroidota bacterium]
MPNQRPPNNAPAAVPCPIISIGDAPRFPDVPSSSSEPPIDEKPEWTPLYKIVDNSIRADADSPPNILPRQKLSEARKAEIVERIRTGFYTDRQITTSVIGQMAEAI